MASDSFNFLVNLTIPLRDYYFSPSLASMDLKLLDDLESQINKTIEQTQSELAERTCCIYNVPSTLHATNGKEAYFYQFVSIGPRRSQSIVVKEMEKHKVKFLADLLMRKNNLGFNDLIKSIEPHEEKARECYSTEINLESFKSNDRFLRKMVLDGCFLIELFLKAADQKSSKDPLGKYMPQAVPRVYGDLLMVGNQIPFFVLEELFTTIKNKPDASETSRMPEESINASLSFLALRFIYKVMQWPDGVVIEKFRPREIRATPENQKPLHLLDLVRSSFIPAHDPETPRNNEAACRLIHSISKLRRVGIKLKLIEKAESFLDVKFRKGAIQMPNIKMDYNMKTFLLNCLAFEQLHEYHCLSKHFTVYASFLDCLVNTASDVGHLCESNIVDSYFGSHDDVAQFINKMGKDLAFDDSQFYLSHVFKDVSDRYQSKYSVQWASFKSTYFNSPWSFISALAALVLLVLTLSQTFYTIYAYYVKSKP
jgi:hypothetical protein